MKTAIRTIIVIMTALMVMAISSAVVSASDTEIRSIDISGSDITLDAGAHTGLRVSLSYTGDEPAEKVEWTSSNSSVASVAGGSVTARSAGTAVITASIGGVSDRITVTVRAIAPTWANATECYKILNSYRKAKHSKKIKALKRDRRLEKIAMTRAKEMAESGRFSHTRPNGRSGVTLIKGKKAKGENIAKGQRSSAEVSAAWYASPGHRKNMLRKNFKKVGIAGYTYNGVTYWAEVFSS